MNTIGLSSSLSSSTTLDGGSPAHSAASAGPLPNQQLSINNKATRTGPPPAPTTNLQNNGTGKSNGTSPCPSHRSYSNTPPPPTNLAAPFLRKRADSQPFVTFKRPKDSVGSGKSKNETFTGIEGARLIRQYRKKFIITKLTSSAGRINSIQSLKRGSEDLNGEIVSGLGVPGGRNHELHEKILPQKRSPIVKCLESLQWCYEKSGIKHIIPIVLLIGYSLIGGVLFWKLEGHGEEQFIEAKVAYIQDEVNHVFNKLKDVRDRRLDKHLAITMLKESTYWFTLSLYYLTEDKMKERNHFEGNKFGLSVGKKGRKAYKVMHELDQIRLFTDQMAERCWEISIEANGDDAVLQRKLKDAFVLFEKYSGLSLKVHRSWTFWNAMFLAMTTYTTIGYGNVAPKSVEGRVVAIFYAAFGIPLFLMILHKLGRLFLALLQKLWDAVLWIFANLFNCGTRIAKMKSSGVVLETSRGRESFDVPVSLAVGVTFAWIVACGVIFFYLENEWDYFTAFYFTFISLTTIGYGDVVPSRSEDFFFTFMLIIVGLSLVSMCINVVQIKLEHLFEDLMLMMMEEYQSAQILDGDMKGPPPDMKAKMGMKTLWKMWQKKKTREQRANSATSLVPPVPDSRNLMLPFLSKAKKDQIMYEWRRKATMRIKGTQTDIKTWWESEPVSTQTSPEMSLAHAQANTILPVNTIWQPHALSLVPEYDDSPSITTEGGEREDGRGSVGSRASLITASSKNGTVVTEADVHLESAECNSPLTDRHRYMASAGEPSTSRFYRGKETSGSPVISSVSWPQHTRVTCHINEAQPLKCGGKSWTFVPSSASQTKSGYVGHVGQQRGLVHAMAMKKQSKQVFRDDLKGLMREIDLRLNDCRLLSTPPPPPPKPSMVRRQSHFM